MYRLPIDLRDLMMAFENTITEEDLDANTRQYVQGLRADDFDAEPDLAVDGLSDSLLSRLLGLFGTGRSGR
jgi:hypothetical protein